MVILIRRAASGGNGNDVVRHNVRRNETHLIESINANAVIHHEGNEANGDIKVVASAGDGRTHQSGSENSRGKSAVGASATTCSATHFDWLYPKSSSSIFSLKSVSCRTDLTAQPNTKVVET